jgi:protein TonB
MRSMRSVFHSYAPDSRHTPLRRRATAIALTAGVHLLLLLMLLRLAPWIPPPPPGGKNTAIFDVMPEEKAATPRAAKTERAKQAASAAAPRTVTPPTPTPVEEPPAATMPPGFILMTRQQYAATDIGTMPKAAGSAGGGASQGTGNDAATADAGGGGGADQLHDADWYRKPTDAELAFYLPKGNRVIGWGMIACRTVANYRVEDCRELGQSPAGSGLSRAVREAAWQFRVMPPRIGGRQVVGAWVRIRIDYTERGARLGN